MKLSYILPALLTGSVSAFSVLPNARSTSSTQLQAEMGRREMVAATAFTASALFVPVEAAFAKDYVPKVDDMKQIYCK